MEEKHKIKVSHSDAKRLHHLKIETEKAYTEMAKIISPYLGGYDYKINCFPPSKMMQRVDYDFFDDGNGHCGVYDHGRGVCESIEC